MTTIPVIFFEGFVKVFARKDIKVTEKMNKNIDNQVDL